MTNFMTFFLTQNPCLSLSPDIEMSFDFYGQLIIPPDRPHLQQALEIKISILRAMVDEKLAFP